MDSMYALPVEVALVLGVAVAVAFSLFVHWAIRRWFQTKALAMHNDVAGFIAGIAGTLYAVVLGFVTVIVWQQYDGTKERLALETAAVTDTWHTSVGLPPDVRSRLRHSMLDYAKLMGEVEWPKMRRGGVAAEGDAVIMTAIDSVGSVHSNDGGVINAQIVTMNLLNQLHDARLRRVAGNRNVGLSWFEWSVLGLGFAIIVALCCLFGVANERVHLIMVGSVALLVSSMFVLIFEMQYPFRSGMAIEAAPWHGVVEHIRYMDTAGSKMNMQM